MRQDVRGRRLTPEVSIICLIALETALLVIGLYGARAERNILGVLDRGRPNFR
jgi:hypothetical protein